MSAQKTMREGARLRSQVQHFEQLMDGISDAIELSELGEESLYNDLETEVTDLEHTVHKLEFTIMLSGKYDSEDAIIAIHSGTGGVDAMDWAAMLERMYLRWAELRGFKVQLIDRSIGEDAGIKSATYAISGDWVFGYLRSERGVHRLVRLSPFDAAHRRHTSFALVEIWPDVQGEIAIQINSDDLQIDTFRAGGAGGQNVQKNETAIRITHLPSGIVVSCQNERSLTQNRESAMRVLIARLAEMEREKQEAELALLKGDYVDANFGNQIRSYVLHPYQMVKDHRTNHETANTNAILEGQIDEFMEAYLKSPFSRR